jgi:hypothetical protein
MLFGFYFVQEGLKFGFANSKLLADFVRIDFAFFDVAVNRHIGDPKGGGEFLDKKKFFFDFFYFWRHDY